MSHRKQADYDFALQLWHKGIITTSRNLFEQSDLTKIESLLASGMLQPVQYDSNKYASVNLFKPHLICEIKRKGTDKLYKKSRFMV